MTLPPYADRVLGIVERIPPGRVLTYGDVAEMAGEGGPRQVGRVLATWGGAVPWWRVVRADGTPVPALAERAYELLGGEGTPLWEGGTTPRVDMAAARWDGR